MSIFNILTKGLFRFKRNRLLENIDHTKMVFDEVATPSLEQAHACFQVLEVKGRMYVELMESFSEKTGIRKNTDFLADWKDLNANARQNLNFLEEQVKKTLENDTYSDGISILKAQLITAISAMEYISSNTQTLLSLMLVNAEDTEDKKNSVSSSVYQEAYLIASKVFSLLASHGKPTKDYQKVFRSIPDAIVTPANREQVLSAWGREAEPFTESMASGFVPNFPLMVVDTIATLRLWMYERDKLAKKQMEMRIMYLENRKEHGNTAAIEKQIKNYEKEIEKLGDKIENFKQKYGGEE